MPNAHRARCTCSPKKLNSELDFIKSTLLDNGYPETVKNKNLNTTTQNPPDDQEQPDRKIVTTRLPFIGTISTVFKQRIKAAVSRCYPDASLRVILSSKPIPPSAQEDVLPTMNRSNLIYQYTCHCNRRYVGRTSQRLGTRIRQHVPVYVRTNTRRDKTPESSIGKHLRANDECRAHYKDDRFQILGFERSEFHLSVLGSLHIMNKQPELCNVHTKEICIFYLVIFTYKLLLRVIPQDY